MRSTSVKLMPEIESPCMKDLGDRCAGLVKEGEVSIFPVSSMRDLSFVVVLFFLLLFLFCYFLC